MNRTWCDIESVQERAHNAQPAEFNLVVPDFVLVGVPTERGDIFPNESKTMSTMLFAIDQERGLFPIGDPLRYMHVVQATPRLDDLWLSVGRTWQSDLTVNDYTVSRIHARMYPAPSRFGFWLEDLGSTNGTWVNDVELKPRQRVLVQTQDNLRFGRQNLILLAPWDFCLMLQEMG